MIVLSWNVRGLGAKIKRSSIRKITSTKNPWFVFVQETKMESIDQRIVKSCWNCDNLDWKFSPSIGNSGGILSIWEVDYFSLESTRIEPNWIAIVGTIPSKNLRCILINLYNPCDVERRKEVWNEIEEMCKSLGIPCLIMGDCNEVTHPSERGSLMVSQTGMYDFKNFIQNNNLLDIPPSNGSFTWIRGNSKSRLDRLLISHEWLEIYPSFKTTLLNRTLSDHSPILASTSDKNWGPKPFRFLNAWLSHPNCLKVIKDSWLATENLPISEKLKAVKTSLKEWNTFEFGFIDQNIESLEKKLKILDEIADSRILDSQELNERRQIQSDLWDWMKRKEIFWAQKSRATWLREGDKNTRFFHVTASIRKRKNCIDSLHVNGSIIDTPIEIRRAAVDYFKTIFQEKFKNRPTLTNLNFKKISSEQANNIIAPFSDSEIDEAVASCAADKAPGPDGFNFHFIKAAWETIRGEVYTMVHRFWSSSQLPRGSNVAFIVLIPKTASPEGLKDYRPISMVGCLYKIVAKLLARRMQPVMSSIISPFQSSFVKGRQILDGALIAAELIDTYKKHRLQAAILKIDFHKAFDNVSWDFLNWALGEMGFPYQWIKWILSCVTTASASILINGSPSTPFNLQRGLRQGDPLSPFLFDIAAEVLHLMIEKSTSLNLWEGLEINPGGLKISHLQYADDTIIFCPPRIDFLTNIKNALILFHLVSGLQVNFHKSSLMGVNVEDSWLETAASRLLCKKGDLPFIYLGLPIGANIGRLSTWAPIITRMEKKLSSWKANLLSIGGRLTLIKSSLSSLPLYYMSLFPIPKSIIERLIRIQRQFLWSGRAEKKAMPLVAWSTVELPKKLGGLAVGNLLNRNLGLLSKWIWRYLTEPSALWRKVIQGKYKYTANLTIPSLEAPKTGGPWKQICSALLTNQPTCNLLKSGMRKRVGNGEKTLFWEESWLESRPLKFIFPRLYSITTNKQAKIASMGFWNGTSWWWSLTWKRSLRHRDTLERESLQQLLDKVILRPDSEDRNIWAPDKNGKFSVKSVTYELAKFTSTAHLDSVNNIWRGLVPHRIEIFTWIACLEKLNTRAKLAKLNIIPPTEDLCPLCNECSETVNHLLLHCRFSWKIWTWWCNLWDFSWVMPATLIEAYKNWHHHSKRKFLKKIWMASFFVIVWSLWKERNGRIFQNIACSDRQIQELILLRLSWWIKGWGDPFPYSSDEVLRNPQCLDWNPPTSQPAPTASKQSSWVPPPPNALKWNVDASLKVSESKSAIGGILRNHRGEFLCMFSSPVPFLEINHGEILAIFRALKISSTMDCCLHKKIIVESDSANAVKWCNGDIDGPWSLAFIINFIKNAMARDNSMEITYQGRESNMVADSLAKQGLTRRDEFIAWM